MKISLVEPKSPFFNFYSPVLKKLPLLGPVYLGTMLKNQGHDVTIYNENIKAIDYAQIKDSDVLGISTITCTAPHGYEIAANFRKINSKGKVIIGGSHATFLPEEAAKYADVVVTGEAESIISEIISMDKDGGAKIVPGRPTENLDDLPFPDFTLIQGFPKIPRFTPVSTSRGCPFDCTFCSVTAMFGRKYRFRSTESIIEELSRLKHRHVFFYDDNFDGNKERLKTLLSEMISRKLTPPWVAQVRADVGKDEELVKLMARSNCRTLCIGFESVNPEMLKKYNKRYTPDDVVKCIDMLHKYGIWVHGMFISEGYTDYDKLGVDSLQLSILVPLLGTRLHTKVKNAKQFIIGKFPNDWKLFDGGHVIHRPDKMSPFELQEQTVQALKKYYSKPKATKMLLTGHWKDFKIRLAGSIIIRKWEMQNKDYLARLKELKTTT